MDGRGVNESDWSRSARSKRMAADDSSQRHLK